ncbi:hypothetical protein [Corynebacterium xerosis]|uniref:hypothetical protein n=1 Tax=Corynebacterium xerosis TaxID=1725 RepID=UPI0011AF2F1D|nr:hypothetical protein [Corynebacterium xerosis]
MTNDTETASTQARAAPDGAGSAAKGAASGAGSAVKGVASGATGRLKSLVRRKNRDLDETGMVDDEGDSES